ncbi:flagellar M-ring protein FliF [Sandaracinobacter sp. RS1-74]|uniref:flagellar basal-body MS-ring/collar protein FliF n=1 Tax=Sandaracinobacteroides sayramensis TaxID=2913411 RepID=UPI001EDC7A32|nr:flagellar basal-body MS-ring/collar protein FliF [Sandaracinobacteroides sayramensis]MCG2841965.1 flagellar M-ring protein FliF [Sandaracinobacteroides sayramensis]
MADAAVSPASLPDRPALPAALAGPLDKLRASPLASRAALPALAAAAIALALIGWLIFAPPERAPLFRQLPESDKAAVVAALEQAGMKVALDRATGDVLLPPDDHARARMLLAGQGLPRAAPGGAELLADMPLGTSRAIEGARLKSAQERDLAASIESLQGVEAARVLIAQPEASPFVRERAPVTASVTLTLAPGRTLSDAQARSIVHLVAGAVPGLSPDNVAIADQMGRMLAGEPGAGRMSADDRRLRVQAEMEARARQSILALLGPVVGPENVSAQVSVELDFAAREASQERYDKEGALRSEQSSRSTSSEPRAMGIPGALSNTIPSAATVTATPPPAASGPTVQTTGNESATRNYELGRSVEVTSRSGGQVRRLTAAVAIRADALGPAAGQAKVLADIRALVEGAVGYDEGRGDRIAVAARPFAAPVETEVPLWKEPVVVESAKWLAVALVAVALIGFVLRPLTRRFLQRTARPAALPAPELLPEPQPILPVDYSAKLAEARLLAATDSARATAVARRLLAAPAETEEVKA